MVTERHCYIPLYYYSRRHGAILTTQDYLLRDMKTFPQKPYNNSLIDQACSVKMPRYRESVLVYKHAKKKTLPTSSHLDLTLGSHKFRLLPSASHLFALSKYSDFRLSIDPQTSLRSSSKNSLADSSASEVCFTSSMLDSFNCRRRSKR